jgi:ClpA/ClpB-like protein/uncharacterized protein DUF4177
VFERFTDRARQAVVLAQDEARTLRHNYIGTEHILLGLLREEEGVAAHVLTDLGVTLEGTRAQIAQIVGQGGEVATGQIPFTPRTKKVLELSLREALSLGHNYIGTEHILLGLTREGEGVASRILLDFGVEGQRVREAIVKTLDLDMASLERLTRGKRRWRPGRPVAMVGGHAPCWEYRVEKRDAVDADWLNELGAEGWELVSVSSSAYTPTEMDGFTVIFKRRQFPGALRAAG